MRVKCALWIQTKMDFFKTVFWRIYFRFPGETTTLRKMRHWKRRLKILGLSSILSCWEGIANDWLRKSLTGKSSKGHDSKWISEEWRTSEFITFVFCDKFLSLLEHWSSTLPYGENRLETDRVYEFFREIKFYEALTYLPLEF